MKTKLMAVITILALFAGLLFIILRTTGTPDTGIILVPEGSGYTASWDPFLEDIATRLNLKKVSIKTWATTMELENYLRRAKKLRVLFAEIPVDAMMVKLEADGLLKTFDAGLVEGKPYFPGFLNTVRNVDNQKDLTALPFTMDPWIVLGRKVQADKSNGEIWISIPGKEPAGVLAVYGITASLVSADAGKDKILELISSCQQEGIFQPNAFTYNQADSFSLCYEGTASYALMPLSWYRSLSTDIALETEIIDTPKINDRTSDALVSEGTALISPKNSGKRAFTDEQIIELATDPAIIYGIAKQRNILPATFDTQVRDGQSDRIRTRALGTPRFIFPAMMYKDETERAALVEEIQELLTSR